MNGRGNTVTTLGDVVVIAVDARTADGWFFRQGLELLSNEVNRCRLTRADVLDEALNAFRSVQRRSDATGESEVDEPAARPESELMSRSEVADVFGCDPSTVTRNVRKWRLVKVGRKYTRASVNERLARGDTR